MYIKLSHINREFFIFRNWKTEIYLEKYVTVDLVNKFKLIKIIFVSRYFINKFKL